MSPNLKSKRPAPEAYDHLWSLLPVFAVFFAIIFFVATADDRPMQGGIATPFVPFPTLALAQSQPAATDGSVPSAADAMARLPDVIAEPVASY